MALHPARFTVSSKQANFSIPENQTVLQYTLCMQVKEKWFRVWKHHLIYPNSLYNRQAMWLNGSKYSEYGWPHMSAQAVLESSSTSYWLSWRVRFDPRPVHVGCRGSGTRFVPGNPPPVSFHACPILAFIYPQHFIITTIDYVLK